MLTVWESDEEDSTPSDGSDRDMVWFDSYSSSVMLKLLKGGFFNESSFFTGSADNEDFPFYRLSIPSYNSYRAS